MGATVSDPDREAVFFRDNPGNYVLNRFTMSQWEAPPFFILEESRPTDIAEIWRNHCVSAEKRGGRAGGLGWVGRRLQKN